MQIKFKKIHNNAIKPEYEHEGDAGLSLRSLFDYDVSPNVVIKVHTGISIELPPGYEAQIRPRSGLALKHGISIVNAPGTIDPNYRGEICVLLIKLTKYNYKIKAGDAIAQMVISKFESVGFDEVDELNNTNRGENGFGSTGR